MEDKELKHKQFDVMKSIAFRRIGKKKIYADYEVKRVLEELRGKGLEDAEVLVRMTKKLIDEHNSKIKAHSERIENLRFQEGTKLDSKYFTGIDAQKVFKAVSENPHLDYYDIANQLEPLI